MTVTDPNATEPQQQTTEPSAEQTTATESQSEAQPNAEGMYPAAVVEELRKEAARYRSRSRDYETVYGGYSDEDRSTWLGLAQLYQQDPRRAAEWMAQQAQTILGEGGDPTDPEEYEGDIGEYVTRDELTAFFAEQQETSALESDVADITRKAESLGYEPGTREFVDLLWIANNETEGDIDAAHAALEAAQEQIIAEYLEKKKADADGTPLTPRGSGGVPSNEDVPKDWKAARAAAVERIMQST